MSSPHFRRLVALNERQQTSVAKEYAIRRTLAVAGLYAVVAAGVAGRRREFGVRTAVGATPRALLALVLREGLQVAVVGACAGLLAALASGRLVASLLHGVTPTDTATLAGAVVALLGACAAAILLPAQRAACADPARELRAE